jgi:hypothetical protein
MPRCKDIAKMDLNEFGPEYVDWIHVAHDRDY